jgi:hypothetical protein
MQNQNPVVFAFPNPTLAQNARAGHPPSYLTLSTRLAELPAYRSRHGIEVKMLRENRWQRLRYLLIYAISLFVCWASLAVALSVGGKYLSVLSWNLFGLEELCRYVVAHVSGQELARTIMGPASFVAAGLAAPFFTVATALIRSPKLRAAGIVIGIVLGVATLVWFPNPWENL